MAVLFTFSRKSIEMTEAHLNYNSRKGGEIKKSAGFNIFLADKLTCDMCDS